MIHVEVSNNDAVTDAFKLLQGIDKGAKKAISRALNRTSVGARAEIVKAIHQTHEIRSRDVREAIKIKKAHWGNLEAQVHSLGAVNPLEQFNHSPKGYQLPRPKVGVRVKVRKGSKGGVIPRTFFRANNPHIFRRITDDSKSDLEKLFGPAIPSMMRVVLDEDAEQGIQDRAETRFNRELNHEIDFMLSKGAK